LPYEILSKRQLGNSGNLFEMEVAAPLISKKAFAGNFILIRINERGERFPLFIADYDSYAGKITIVFQIAGKSTKLLSRQNVGDKILDVIGPAGNKTNVKKLQKPIIIIGGGVGIAACYLQAKEWKKAGNEVISIIYAKNREFLFWKERIYAVSDDLIVCTEDGSEGLIGNVIEPLKNILKQKEISLILVIGPLILTESVSLLTNGENGIPKIETQVSLNTIMLCGMGICGSCRYLTKDGSIKFACLNGPIVDGHSIDFDNLLKRSLRYIYEEVLSLRQYEKELNIIGILQNIQDYYGYLPTNVLEFVSKKLKLPLAEIYSIATFYSQFKFNEVGQYTITCCDGTACHVKGAPLLLNFIETFLGIQPGETTSDKIFTLQKVACLGCCAISPVCVINGQIYGDLSLNKLRKILNKLKEANTNEI
jgi:ferredoxin--NADP+ reductase